MKEQILKMKCKCGNTMPSEKCIIQSVNLAGVCYTLCPYCNTPSIVAGNTLVELTGDASEQVLVDYEYSVKALLDDDFGALMKNTPENARKFVAELLELSKLGFEESIKDIREKKTANKNKVKQAELTKEVKTTPVKRKAIKLKPKEPAKTQYGILIEGKLVDRFEAYSNVNQKEIFKSLASQYGAEQLANGTVELFELKKVTPSVKKKVTYDFI